MIIDITPECPQCGTPTTAKPKDILLPVREGASFSDMVRLLCATEQCRTDVVFECMTDAVWQ